MNKIFLKSLLLLLILLTGCNLVNKNKSLARPYYWNQQEADSLNFIIFQPRKINLTLNADSPSLLYQQAFLLNNTVYCFKDDGSFKEKITYNNSKIKLHFPPDHLVFPSSIQEVNYRWYNPKQSFKKMDLLIYNDSLSVHYLQDSTKTWVDIEIFYPKRLELEKVYIQQSRILGGDVYYKKNPIKSKYNISKILTHRKGYLKLRTDIFIFMEKFGNFYNKPNQMNLHTRFQFIPSKAEINTQQLRKKNPKFKHKKYVGRGNYYYEAPSLEPYYKINVNAEQKILMYEHYFPEEKKKKWKKRKKSIIKSK